jgi:hypothetical protein
MSEYQLVHFLAIDRPLDDEQLEFMRRQSSRAEVTRWEFRNEYHYGDFHGNTREMLRRGYDVHLHYANFGIRRLMFRLPTGLPCDRRTFEAFQVEHALQWLADKSGSGGALDIAPEADADTYDEELYEVDDMLQDIAPARELLVAGDLRVLYLAWLACACDEESLEPPVPAGLGDLAPALKAMTDYYALSEDVIAAAATRSPPLPASTDAGEALKKWIAKQSQRSLRALVARFLTNDAAAARAETLASIRAEMPAAAWPMAEPTRTLGQLRESACGLRDERLRQEEEARQAARRKQLQAMAADPRKVMANVERLVAERSTGSYVQAASELADLREALGPDVGPAKARAFAAKLRRENPRRSGLVAAVRKHGLLD